MRRNYKTPQFMIVELFEQTDVLCTSTEREVQWDSAWNEALELDDGWN